MRTNTLSVLVAAAVTVAVSSPDAARADAVPFTSLPVIPSTAKPVTPPAPERIPANEHAEGIFPALLPEAQRKDAEKAGYHYVQVFGTEKEAQRYATEGTISQSEGDHEKSAPRVCLNTGGSLAPNLSIYVRTKPYVQAKPSPAMIQRLKAQHRWPPPPPTVSKTPPKDTVTVIHVERFAQAGDSATVESTEAFLDLQTLGTRFVSKTTAKLTRVAAGPNSLGVYAARDDKGISQFLVTNPELPPTALESDREAQVAELSSVANRLITQLPTGESSETGCGYVRFSLAAKPGAGQMATVLATAFLPPSSGPDDGAADDESRFETEDLNEDQLKVIRDMVHRQNRSQRARTVAVNLSLSQLETETSPLLSVTFGWAGKDQQLRF